MGKKAAPEKNKNLSGTIENLGFKYERKRIKKKVKLPPLCPDYEPVSYGDWCKKASLCKNATNIWQGEVGGTCHGGTDAEERERRKDRFVVAIK